MADLGVGPLRVSLLGPVTVTRGDETLPVAGVKLQALVALLALAVPRPVSTDRLVAEIWGDAPPGNPTNALQAQVSQLRRLLGNDAVGRTGSGYALQLEADAIDALVLERLVDEGRAAAREGDLAAAADRFGDAVALVRGVALQDLLDLPFALEASTRLEQLVLAAHEGRNDARLAAGAHAELVDALQHLVGIHPLRERFHAQLITALYRSGRQADALAAYEHVRRLLAEELGLDPGPELRELERAVLTHDPALAAPIPLSTDRARKALPAALTALVGREQELARLEEMLRAHRLVSVVGPGGVGKTRLVVEHLVCVGDAQEVWFVELAPVTDPVAVPEAVATAVGAVDRASSDDPKAVRPPNARTVDRIGGRAVTLVLDNCEHVAEAVAGTVGALLAGCPRLTILATSREPLGLPGEVQLPVTPLAEADAVALFTQRARAVQPEFSAGPSEADLTQLCRRLDHLPLAIELAAARIKSLALTEIAGRLDDRFDLLRRSGRAGDPRHHGLGAAIDWSYDLLFEDERRAFCRLALFAGGATVDAAESVCGPDALDVLERLVDRSLLVVDASGHRSRFRMLESLRAYGLARLEEAGDLAAAQASYVAWALALAERAERAVRSADQVLWLDRLDAEHDNLRAALSYVVGVEPATALRLVGMLVLPWYLRGRRQEARHWVEEALAAADDTTDPALLAKALAWAGFIAESSGWTGTPGGIEQELELAEQRQRRALALVEDIDAPVLVADLRMLLLVTMTRRAVAGIDVRSEDITAMIPAATRAYEELGDRYGLSLIRLMVAIVSLVAGDLHGAAVAATEAQAHVKATGERFTQSRVEWLRGMLADVSGDPRLAYRHIERSLRLLDELGNGPAVTAQAVLLVPLAERTGRPELAAQWRRYLAERAPDAAQDDLLTMASARNAEAQVARRRGDLERARHAHLEARQMFKEANVRSGLAFTESSLGFLAAEAGDEAAVGHHAAALAAAVVADEPASLALAFDGVACLLVHDEPIVAAELLGAADRLWARAPGAVASHRDEVARAAAVARRILGADAVAAARARGASLDPTAAMAAAHGAILAMQAPST